MRIRKDLILAVLTTLCLSIVLFSVLPSNSGLPYDPWTDIDDNGKIDMKDVGAVASRFATSGDSTKTVRISGYDSSTSWQNITIPPHASGNINITTGNYSRVTLGLTASNGSGQMNLGTWFVLNDYYSIGMDNITVPSQSPSTLWLTPSTVALQGKSVGYKFNATGWANLTQSSFTWQITCNFNGSTLKVDRVGYTNGATSQFFSGHSTIPVTPIITTSSVSMGESLIGSDARAPGNGSLCWFEFEVKAASTTEKLSISNTDTFALTGDLTEIPTTAAPRLFQTYRTYTIIGPALRIDYANPYENAAGFRIDIFLTTAP